MGTKTGKTSCVDHYSLNNILMGKLEMSTLQRKRYDLENQL